VAFVALVAETFVAVVRFLRPVKAAGFGGLVRAGKADEFSPGSVHTIQEGRFHLVRLEDGSFLAMWQRCTHLGCSVPWKADENQFHCPCHGSLFDKKGLVVGGPAPRPLDFFPIEIKDGEVFVDTGKPVTRTVFDQSQTTTV
jgi:cytochrome b6-f complex iron-sulfur subunit